jgi:hypothetical protein
VFDYIERFHDAIRRHSTLGDVTPSRSKSKRCQLNRVSMEPAATQPAMPPDRSSCA